MKRLLMCTACVLLLSAGLFAQVPVRQDDHFFKRRVVNRISLVEKINRPLAYHESNLYSDNEKFSQQDGIVASLIQGVKAGKYRAYDPNDWQNTFDYDQLVERMEEFDKAIQVNYGEENWSTGEEFEREDEVFGAGEEEIWEEENFEDSDDWDDDWEEDVLVEDEIDMPAKQQASLDLAPYEDVIHMVEDRVFDKNRSMMVNQIEFFEIIWVDPSGSLPEKVLARFKWSEVKEQLENTKWKARFNDAAGLSIAQALEMRMFHSFLINVGGQGVKSLWEAEKRRQELVEFEHHLWSY